MLLPAEAGKTYADNGELRDAIVEYAMQYLGNVYVHGGKSGVFHNRIPKLSVVRIGLSCRICAVRSRHVAAGLLRRRFAQTEQSAGYVSAEYVTVTETFIYAKSIEEEQAELAAQRALAERARELEEEAARQAAEAQGGQGPAAEQESGADRVSSLMQELVVSAFTNKMSSKLAVMETTKTYPLGSFGERASPAWTHN